MSRPGELQEVALWRVRLPLRTPLRSGHGTEAHRDLILVAVRAADGTVGWGECSALARPTYTGEFTAAAWLVLRDELAPRVLAGEDLDVVGHPMALAAVRGAVRDADLRRAGRSLTDAVAARLGRPRAAVPHTAVVGRMAVDDLLAAVDARVRAGARLVKLKATPRRDDLDAVAAVRATWPTLALAVDGNGTLDGRAVATLDTLDLTYLEQPVPADDLVGSAELARRCATPIALDESVTSVTALETASALGAGAIVNVKPARLGGVDPAVAVVQRAADVGWPVFVGGLLETGVGRATALALAASSACLLPTDLGPSAAYFAADLTAPIVGDDDGLVVVPTGPGIGVAPDPDRLAAAAVDHVVVTPAAGTAP